MTGSWCHFSHRIPLTDTQREYLPSNKKGFEDHKYSYVIIRKAPRGNSCTDDNHLAPLPRIIRRPLKRAGHALVDVCANDQTFKRIIVAKSHGKDVYKDARKAKWGEVWPHPPKKDPIPIVSLHVKKYGKTRGSKKESYTNNNEDDDVIIEGK